MFAFIKYLLIFSALLLEGTAVYKAIEGISNTGGSASDFVIPLVIGTGTFAASFLSFNLKFKGKWWLTSLKRAPLIMVACGLMLITGFTIDTGGKAENIQQSSDNYAERIASAESDYRDAIKQNRELEKQDQALYIRQEENRMSIVSRLEKEIAHSKKVDAQAAYVALVEELAAVRNPLPKPEKRPTPVKEQVTKINEVSDLDYLGTVQANAYGFLVLVLLFLASLIPVDKQPTLQGSRQSPFVFWRKDDRNLHTQGFKNGTGGQVVEADPFEDELIPKKEDDQSVSIKAIEEFFGVGYRVAVKKRNAAVTSGFMYKESNLYFYASRPRQMADKKLPKHVDYDVFPSSKRA